MGADIPGPSHAECLCLPDARQHRRGRRVYAVLSDGGQIFMKMDSTFFGAVLETSSASWMLLARATNNLRTEVDIAAARARLAGARADAAPGTTHSSGGRAIYPKGNGSSDRIIQGPWGVVPFLEVQPPVKKLAASTGNHGAPSRSQPHVWRRARIFLPALRIRPGHASVNSAPRSSKRPDLSAAIDAAEDYADRRGVLSARRAQADIPLAPPRSAPRSSSNSNRSGPRTPSTFRWVTPR